MILMYDRRVCKKKREVSLLERAQPNESLLTLINHRDKMIYYKLKLKKKFCRHRTAQSGVESKPNFFYKIIKTPDK